MMHLFQAHCLILYIKNITLGNQSVSAKLQFYLGPPRSSISNQWKNMHFPLFFHCSSPLSRCGGAPGAGGLLSSPPTPGSTSFPPHSQSLLSSAEGHGPSQNTASVSLSGTPRSRSAREREREDKRSVHIKKPLNAFMLYMKEMRPKIVAECTLKESAAINQILGRRVRLDKLFTKNMEF